MLISLINFVFVQFFLKFSQISIILKSKKYQLKISINTILNHFFDFEMKKVAFSRLLNKKVSVEEVYELKRIDPDMGLDWAGSNGLSLQVISKLGDIKQHHFAYKVTFETDSNKIREYVWSESEQHVKVKN